MSIATTNELGRISTVIGRAYGDEPIKLVAISDWGAAVEVRREGDRDSIGFKKSAVYRFDQALFENLCAAFQSKDKGALASLWSHAEHFDQIVG